jgi:hypothetical protein
VFVRKKDCQLPHKFYFSKGFWFLDFPFVHHRIFWV